MRVLPLHDLGGQQQARLANQSKDFVPFLFQYRCGGPSEGSCDRKTARGRAIGLREQKGHRQIMAPPSKSSPPRRCSAPPRAQLHKLRVERPAVGADASIAEAAGLDVCFGHILRKRKPLKYRASRVSESLESCNFGRARGDMGHCRLLNPDPAFAEEPSLVLEDSNGAIASTQAPYCWTISRAEATALTEQGASLALQESGKDTQGEAVPAQLELGENSPKRLGRSFPPDPPGFGTSR